MTGGDDFRLQTVLNYKSHMVDAIEMEFARLKLAHKHEEAMLVALQETEEHEAETLRQRQTGLLDCSEIVLRQDHLHSLQDHVVQQNDRVHEAAQRVGCKREELVETMQDHEALEKLRERHVARLAKEMDLREARAVDDIVTGRYVRERGHHA